MKHFIYYLYNQNTEIYKIYLSISIKNYFSKESNLKYIK